jgi:hypothetical protein
VPHVPRTPHSRGVVFSDGVESRAAIGLVPNGSPRLTFLEPQIPSEGVLDLWDKIKLFFGARPLPPPDARKLAASSENELSASLQALPIGERGWITLRDAWHLFSSMDEEEAFGEMDDAGKRRIGEFAAYSIHRSEPNFMPTEGRVYFTRK